MSYYIYNETTGEILGWHLERDSIEDGVAVLDCPDQVPNVNQKLVNGSLVVDTEKVNASLANEVREERYVLLKQTDWWSASDLTMTAEQTAYRQALRDVPAQAGFPANVTWPTKPSGA